jgi:hypothetical protein
MRRLSALGLLLFAALGACLASQVDEASGADLRDDPRVKSAVARGLNFIDQWDDFRLGAKALIARANLFADRRDHSSVAQAVASARATISERQVNEPTLIYSLGLGIAFLTELDPVKYRPEIDGLVNLLLARQKTHGGWGYPTSQAGDTSMTQYAVFGLWSASKAGVEVDEQVWISATNWLLRTQDPSGAWGYQGVDPGSFTPVEQSEKRRSMTEAAMASLYLCGEHLRFFRFESEQLKVSRLLRSIDVQALKPPPPAVERRRLDEALRRAARWNETTREPIYHRYPYYHYYTVERLETFRQAALREPAGAEPWHAAGVEDLLKRQNADGSWRGDEGPAVSTAFAILFILRVTRITLVRYEGLVAGTVVGGRGLPQPGTGVGAPEPRPGDVTRRPNQQLADLVRKMDDPQFLAAFQGVENVGPAAQETEPEKLVKRLLELAGDDNPEAKAAALRALGRARNFDDVPVMIEAIRDPNPIVYQTAVDALRRFDRRIEDYGKPLPADDSLRAAEAALWRKWYHTIRPTGR